MRSLIRFIQDFAKNSGGWVFSALVFNKLILFIVKAFVLLYIEKLVYGQITYAISLIAFFTPFVGFGTPAGLLRFGSITESDTEKEQLTNYAFSTGLLNSFLLILISLPFLFFLDKGEIIVLYFSLILTGRILGLFLYNMRSIQFRIMDKNKLFAIYDLCNSLSLLVLAFSLTFFFKAFGYIAALCIYPVINFFTFSFIFGFPRFRFSIPSIFNQKSFWSYSLLSSFTNVITQWVFAVDILLVGNLLGNSATAEYNAAALIPINLLFLPTIVMKTDFPKIAKNYTNAAFLKNYFKNYLILFSLICLALMAGAYFFGEWLFSFLGKDYSPYSLFMVMMLGTCPALLLRVPLTNIISALGKVKINSITGILTLAIDVALNLLLIPKYGLMGAAWATAISLLLSGIMTLIYFIFYLKNLEKQVAL